MLLGNVFEHYDTALFNLLSPFLAPLFFPNQDPLMALILTYCIIPLGMIARPIGALVFGYIGDTYGRQKALIMALVGMAVITVCISMIPTYEQAGLLAPIILSLGRIFQNFFAAGETVGGAIYLIENTDEIDHDKTSSFYNASTVAGVLLASFGVSLLSTLNIIQDYWRVLYLFGCLTAVFASLLRMNSTKSSSSVQLRPSSSLQFIVKTCWKRRQALLTIAIASGFSYACYMIALVMTNSFIPLITSISKIEMINLNNMFILFDFLLLSIMGIFAHRFSREKMMISSGVLALITGLPLFWFLQDAPLNVVIFIRLCFVIIGVWFSAPFYSWSQDLVPSSDRYTVISFAYAIGTQFLGGPTIIISLWLFQKTEWVTSAAWYWMFLGLLASYVIAKEKLAKNQREECLPSM